MTPYEQGFIDKCAELGVDPVKLAGYGSTLWGGIKNIYGRAFGQPEYTPGVVRPGAGIGRAISHYAMPSTWRSDPYSRAQAQVRKQAIQPATAPVAPVAQVAPAAPAARPAQGLGLVTR